MHVFMFVGVVGWLGGYGEGEGLCRGIVRLG